MCIFLGKAIQKSIIGLGREQQQIVLMSDNLNNSHTNPINKTINNHHHPSNHICSSNKKQKRKRSEDDISSQMIITREDMNVEAIRKIKSKRSKSQAKFTDKNVMIPEEEEHREQTGVQIEIKKGFIQQSLPTSLRINMYELTYKRLSEKKINPKHRCKLFKWMAQVCCTLMEKRNTFALADDKQCSGTQRYPNCSNQLFFHCQEDGRYDEACFRRLKSSKQSFKCAVCCSIGYFIKHISPTWIKQLPAGINLAGKDNKLTNKLTFLSNENQLVWRIVGLYDKLDCINAVVYSLRHTYPDICFNLFYLYIYFLIHQDSLNANTLKTSSQIYKDKDHRTIFNEFKLYAQQNKQQRVKLGELQQKIGQYLWPFINLQINLRPRIVSEISYMHNVIVMRNNQKNYSQAALICARMSSQKIVGSTF